MKKLLSLLALGSAFTALGLAEEWSGKLLDATCHDQKNDATVCEPTSNSATFVLNVSGKVYRFNEAGNQKTIAALKNRADRAADPKSIPPAAVQAKVTGTAEGQTIKVDDIEIK